MSTLTGMQTLINVIMLKFVKTLLWLRITFVHRSQRIKNSYAQLLISGNWLAQRLPNDKPTVTQSLRLTTQTCRHFAGVAVTPVKSDRSS